MRKPKAFTVVQGFYGQPVDLCRRCFVKVTKQDDWGHDIWADEPSYWALGSPCADCGAAIGGLLGRIIGWNRTRIRYNEGQRLWKRHQLHDDRCTFGDAECVTGYYTIAE